MTTNDQEPCPCCGGSGDITTIIDPDGSTHSQCDWCGMSWGQLAPTPRSTQEDPQP